MAKFPLDPPYAKCLLSAIRLGCLEQMIAIVAMLSVENIFFNPSDRRDEVQEVRRKMMDYSGDHMTLLQVWQRFHRLKHRSEALEFCTSNFLNHRALEVCFSVFYFCWESVLPMSDKCHDVSGLMDDGRSAWRTCGSSCGRSAFANTSSFRHPPTGTPF